MSAGPIDPPRPAGGYRPPDLLADIRLLDLLELCGSTRQTGEMLQVSQPTVSRRYRALARDFDLHPHTGPQACRYGTTRTMHLLRLSCRCHRLEAGVARIGADLLHHGLLQELPGLLPTPVSFRSVPTWLELVRQGVLDGALLSGLELKEQSGWCADGLELHHLGSLPLALAWPATGTGSLGLGPDGVQVPERSVAPGLQRLLRQGGWTLRNVGAGGCTPQPWLHRLQRSGWAVPVAATIDARRSWARSLRLLPLDAMASPVWLALPRQQPLPPPLASSLLRLQQHPALAGC